MFLFLRSSFLRIRKARGSDNELPTEELNQTGGERAGVRAYTCATDTKKSTSMPRRSCRFTGDDVSARCANASAPLRAASICRRFGGGAPCAGAAGGARFGFMPSARRSPAARATRNRPDGWMDCRRCRRALATPPRRR